MLQLECWKLMIKATCMQGHAKATTSDTSHWNTRPSFPYSMLHSVVSVCLHQFGWNFFPTLASGRGRETQLYRQCFNKVTLIASEKALITCHGIQVFEPKITSWKLASIYGWEKMRCLRWFWSFPKWREEKPNLSFTPKTQKTGIGYRPTCTGEERTPKSPPYNCV